MKMKATLKSRAVRKYFLNHPNAKVKDVAKKFGVYLSDVYAYKGQVERAEKANAGIMVLPDGRIVRGKQLTAEIINKVQPMPILAGQKLKRPTIKKAEPSVVSVDKVVNKFVDKFNLDYKHAYALELLVKGDVKKAAQVLTD